MSNQDKSRKILQDQWYKYIGDIYLLGARVLKMQAPDGNIVKIHKSGNYKIVKL